MKKLFRHGVIAALVLAAGVLYAANQDETVILKENFDNGFTPGVLPQTGKIANGKFQTTGDAHNWSIITDAAASGPNALKVLRDGANGYVSFTPDKPIPAGVDYSVEFKAYTFPGNGMVVFLWGSRT